MGTITAGTIIDRVSVALFDNNNVKWSRTELLDWLNVGQRFIVALSPSVNNTVANISLVAGTRQSIASTGSQLLSAIRNMGTSGTTPGRAVRLVPKKLLDAYNPTWHSDTASTTVQNYCFDEQDPTAFYVYPPSPGTNKLQVNYAKIPSTISSEATALELPDTYEEPLVDYIMFRALTKNVEYGNPEKASGYLELFNQAVGATTTAEEAEAASPLKGAKA